MGNDGGRSYLFAQIVLVPLDTLFVTHLLLLCANLSNILSLIVKLLYCYFQPRQESPHSSRLEHVVCFIKKPLQSTFKYRTEVFFFR